MWLLLLFSACAPEIRGHNVALGTYWLVVPDGVDLTDAPLLLHLDASGAGEEVAHRAATTDALAAAGRAAVFPDGGGVPGDDWNVGINKDDIPRDDTEFLGQVADDLRDRYGELSLWLGGASKGGAMTWEMACLGEPAYDGFVPMSGAIEKPLPHACTNAARPLRHLQGTDDDRWPVQTADNPDSSHMGILDSLEELTAASDGCLDAEPTLVGDCQIWSCTEPLQLCFYDGGHRVPDDWIARQLDTIDTLAP